MEQLARHKKLIIIVGLGLVLFISIAGAGVWILVQNASRQNSDSSGQNGNPGQESLYSQARTVAQNEGDAAAQKLLDEAVEKTSDTTKQAEIYGTKASIASLNNDTQGYTEGLGFALKSYELAPSYDRAGLVAFYYQMTGDKVNAVKYYEIAIAAMGDYDKLDDMTKSSYTYYKSLVEELKRGN